MIEYLKSKNISFTREDENIYSIGEKKFLFLEERERLFDRSFDFNLKEEEFEVECDYYAFKWGTRYYYSPINETQFNQLLYFGEGKEESLYSNLGIHGKYELLNGTRDYKDWVKKAKYLGHKALAICESQTLAGTIQFQKACAEEGIKSILGSTGLIKLDKNKYPIKYYVKNKEGWRNALLLNKEQNVVNANNPHFTIEFLKEHFEGLIFVINPNTPKEIYKHFKKETYFQLDSSELFSNKLDIEWLENTKRFLKEGKFEPVLLQDTYYLEPEDYVAKDFINRISKSNDSNFYKDHYFKSFQELKEQFDELGLEADILANAVRTNREIVEQCNFEIDLKSRHLPKYEMNEDEANQFKSNDELFFHKIQEGLEKKVIPFKGKNIDVYLERINKEVKVLEMGRVKDYFLIMADICRFCDENNIVRGHGRGSAAGSIISYLFSITEVDPIEYGLIFERFLNEGRVQTELPDIDTDVSNRDAVKRYLEDKYGYNYVSSIGTYGNYKLKNLFNDMCSDCGVDSGTMRYMSKIISKEYENGDFTSLMKCCVKNKKLRDFVNQYIAEKADFYPVLLGQPKNKSVHASGVIIVPKEDEDGNLMDIYTWMPVKSMDGHLITEWEGKELEGAGFLKEDLLGLKQLEKFQRILELIKQNHEIDINIFDIDLEDQKVFDYFGEGITEDVFQFGTSGLKGYCNELKPDSVGELAAANALYRPGAMESHAHTDFIKLKFGQKEPEYDYMLEDVTKETSGLMIFQETIMKACQVLGGFSLVEADGIRKAMGKKIKEKMDSYKAQFLAGAKERGCPDDEAEYIWNKLEVFSGYGFNKSHAVCYSIIGYISLWFKVHYPLEFWMTSLEMSTDDERPKRLNEINEYFDINVKAVDINKSGLKFELDKNTNSIYYSISSVKQVGAVSVPNILEEREKNGFFFSLSEFVERIPKKFANKRVIINLILCGAFDEIENIKNERDRFKLIDEYTHKNKIKNTIEDFVPHMHDEFWWQMQKVELSGIGFLNYEKKAIDLGFKDFKGEIDSLRPDKFISIAGICTEIEKKKNDNGNWAIITINSNNELIKALAWQNFLEENESKILSSKGKFLFLSGVTKADYFDSEKRVLSLNNNSKVEVL